MLKKYKVTLVTKGGKRYTFDWDCTFSNLSKVDHASDLLMKHPHFIVKDLGDTCIVVPRAAIDYISMKAIDNDMHDDY